MSVLKSTEDNKEMSSDYLKYCRDKRQGWGGGEIAGLHVSKELWSTERC